MQKISSIYRLRFFLIFFTLLTISLAIFILFLSSKSASPSMRQWLHPFKTIQYHASLIVFISIPGALCLTIFAISPMLRKLKRNNYTRIIVIFSILFASTFPIGYLWKFNSLFYEKWMWYCALWFMGLCLSITAAVFIVLERPNPFNKMCSYLEPLNAFLHNKSSTKSDYWYITGLSFWVLIITLAVNSLLLGGIPHIYDGLAQLFQAKVFSHGCMAMPAPEQPDFFERMYIPIEAGRWYAIYPPGYALILAIGVLFKCPQLVNPLLSALIIPLFFIYARRIASLYVARLGCFFLAFSPFFLLMGGGFMNHPTCLLFILLFLLLLQYSSHTSSAIKIILATGFCAGLAFITRPLTALSFITVASLWFIVRERKNTKRLLKTGLLFGLGALPAFCFYLYFNHQTTGAALRTGYVHYFDANPMGFGDKPWGEHPLGPQIPRGEHHTPLRATANLFCNLNALNSYLFGWPVPSLIFAFLLFAPGLRRTEADWFCISAIIMTQGIYFFYFFQDNCFGPRFLYETIPFWIILTARAIEEIQNRWHNKVLINQSQIRGLLYIILASYFIIAICTSWIERSAQYGDSYWGTRDEMAQLLRRGILEKNAVVFVEDPNDHIAVFSFLDPQLDKGWIIAHDLGAENNRELLMHFPEWPVYRLRIKEDVSTDQLRTVLERDADF